jgi:hypothetical protein
VNLFPIAELILTHAARGDGRGRRRLMGDIRRIRKHMSIIAADGRRVGFVSAFARADKIRVTSLGSSHGFDHLIPISWVSEVRKYVFLSKTSRYVGEHWENLAPPTISASAETAAKAEAWDTPRAA